MRDEDGNDNTVFKRHDDKSGNVDRSDESTSKIELRRSEYIWRRINAKEVRQYSETGGKCGGVNCMCKH